MRVGGAGVPRCRPPVAWGPQRCGAPLPRCSSAWRGGLLGDEGAGRAWWLGRVPPALPEVFGSTGRRSTRRETSCVPNSSRALWRSPRRRPRRGRALSGRPASVPRPTRRRETQRGALWSPSVRFSPHVRAAPNTTRKAPPTPEPSLLADAVHQRPARQRAIAPGARARNRRPSRRLHTGAGARHRGATHGTRIRRSDARHRPRLMI